MEHHLKSWQGADWVFTAPENGNYGVVLKKDSGDRWTFPGGPDPLDLPDNIKVSEKEG